MRGSKLENISQSLKERLLHIDFLLMFEGNVPLTTFAKRCSFRVSGAAMRGLLLKKRLVLSNLQYGTKAYNGFGCFKNLFNCVQIQFFFSLYQGGNGECVSATTTSITAEISTKVNLLELEALSIITRTIYHEKAMYIHYSPISSGKTNRVIVLFALADYELNWYVRADDVKRPMALVIWLLLLALHLRSMEHGTHQARISTMELGGLK
ncbi:hypothetical protein BZG06_15030 [Salinivibrio kushneri]|uniref:WYL domain-containing protein n=2 Tax=Salinivibrio kushneri TaxID=1908198 RepID=A0AB36K027_9GAMM|nr:hypothetical protein BZG06_15030 [Salinivibrio kushneri]OOE40878.1 hypothetical protein BZG09_16180 [Salinivibrio kushneri]